MRRSLATLLETMLAASLVTGCSTVAGVGTDANPRVVQITITGFRFVPDTIDVTRGESVQFVIHNPTDQAHELYIGSPTEQQADETAHASASPMEQPQVSTRYGYGVYLPAYSDSEFRYHFSTGSEVMIGCHLPGHWAAGMKAAITVHPG